MSSTTISQTKLIVCQRADPIEVEIPKGMTLEKLHLQARKGWSFSLSEQQRGVNRLFTGHITRTGKRKIHLVSFPKGVEIDCSVVNLVQDQLNLAAISPEEFLAFVAFLENSELQYPIPTMGVKGRGGLVVQRPIHSAWDPNRHSHHARYSISVLESFEKLHDYNLAFAEKEDDKP